MKITNKIMTSGTAIDASQMYQMSLQIVSAAGATGSVQIQVSNDPQPVGYQPQPVVVNWVALGSPVTITAATVQLVAAQNMAYVCMRVVVTGTGTVACTVMATCA